MISKIYVSDCVITMNLWNLKGYSPVTKLSNRHTRHYDIATKEREREREKERDVMQNMQGFNFF
jgi:hypothetical protein